MRDLLISVLDGIFYKDYFWVKNLRLCTILCSNWMILTNNDELLNKKNQLPFAFCETKQFIDDAKCLTCFN